MGSGRVLQLIRRTLAALAVAGALIVGTVAPAEAHSFGALGPPHEHYACVNNGVFDWVNGNHTTFDNTCMRWILQNGAIIQGPRSLRTQHRNLILVWCSWSTITVGWQYNHTPYGPYRNTSDHPFCQSPTYNGTPWSVRN